MDQQSAGSTKRGAIDHTLMSAGALAFVVMAVVLFDQRAQRALTSLVNDTHASGVMQIGSSAQRLGGVLVAALAEQSIANAPLAIFVVIAAALTLFMVRT
jgi:hypothetical protein